MASEAGTGWEDIQSSVTSIKDLVDACIIAFGPEADKVSSTTKKRMAQRALAGLSRGRELVQVLGQNLQQLQQVSRGWQHNVVHISKSHEDILQQLNHTSDELSACQDKLRQADAERLAANLEIEKFRQQLEGAAADKQGLESTIDRLESELQSAAFGANEASCHLSDLRAQMDQLAAATLNAEEAAAAAASALDAAKQEASKERAARQRHEDAVARLTADNLVFMAKLRAAESAAATATAERDELVLALEEHKGPWMDEVHQGVEARVKEALSRAQELEQQQEQIVAQHAAELEQMRQQHADLEAALAQASHQESSLRSLLAAAEATAAEARAAAEEAQVLAAEAQASADQRAAELRVAQESLRTMREECNERWMSERAARAELAELQTQLAELESERDQLKTAVQARSDALMTQRAVNQQLMLKKEEVEWQLMAAIAKFNYEASNSPMSGALSPISPHLASLSHQQQQQAPCGVVNAEVHTCDAVTNLLTGHAPHQPSTQQQQQLPACWSGDATQHTPFLQSIHQAFPERSPGNAPAALPEPCQQGIDPASLSVKKKQQHQQQQPTVAGKVSGSPPKPSVFCTAATAAAAASGARSSSDELGSKTAQPNQVPTGFAGLCISTSLPAAFDVSGFSSSLPDMFSLPSLSYGLATLPPPEMLVAAASRTLNCSAAPWGETLGLANSGSLGIGASAGLVPAGSGSSAGGDTGSPTGSLRGGFSKGVVVGTTGGLMAPFSPLPRAHLGSIGSGAIFPESLTASAVTDAEQLTVKNFSLPPDLLQQVQQLHQQLADQHTELQCKLENPAGVKQLFPTHQQQQASKQAAQQVDDGITCSQVQTSTPLPASTATASSSSTGACDSSRGASTVPVKRPLVHPAFAQAACTVRASSPVASNTVTATQGSSRSGGSSPDVQPHQQLRPVLHDAKAADNSVTNAFLGNAGNSLHGILVRKPHDKLHSPARGVSPSGSAKSVRFSFENLDQSLGHDAMLSSPQSPRDKLELHDQCSTKGTVPAAAKQHQLSMPEHDAWVAPAGSYDGFRSSSGGGWYSSGSSAQRSPLHPSLHATGRAGASASGYAHHSSGFHNAGPATSPPADMCFSIRAGHVARSEAGSDSFGTSCSSRSYQQQCALQQQHLQHAKAAAAARASAAVVASPLPKGPPVHPVFGAFVPRSAPASTAGTPP